MEADDLGHWSRNAVAKVATHSVPNHFAQFLNCLTLSGDGVTQRGCHIPTVHLILLHFKNDLSHETNLDAAAPDSKNADKRKSKIRVKGDTEPGFTRITRIHTKLNRSKLRQQRVKDQKTKGPRDQKTTARRNIRTSSLLFVPIS